jgi:hypothetical protein
MCSCVPIAGRLPPPFIGQGEAATSMLHSVVYRDGVLAHSMLGMTVVLVDLRACRGLMANFGFRRRRGDSCACRGTTSRGGLTDVRAWLSSVRQSRVRPHLFEGLAAGESFGAIGVGVAMSCQHRAPQRWGWLHSAGDGHTAPGMVEKTCFA